MKQSRQILTTGDVAKYCGVHFRTVTRWIRNGHLKAFSLPGRGDSRIFLGDFLHFLKTHNIDVPEEFKKSAGPPRALVVEDDPVIAKNIRRILEALKIDCVVAHDGFHAGALLTSFHPRLVTLDLGMPGLGGLSVLKIIRSLKGLEDVSVLVISGMGDRELQKALDAGADGVLRKPFTKQQLEDYAKKLLLLERKDHVQAQA